MPETEPPDVRKMKVSGDVKGLLNALGYKWSWDVRVEAATALGEIGLRQVKPDMLSRVIRTLIAVVHDAGGDRTVRWRSVWALGKIGARLDDPAMLARVIDVLRAALKEIGRAHV